MRSRTSREIERCAPPPPLPPPPPSRRRRRRLLSPHALASPAARSGGSRCFRSEPGRGRRRAPRCTDRYSASHGARARWLPDPPASPPPAPLPDPTAPAEGRARPRAVVVAAGRCAGRGTSFCSIKLYQLWTWAWGEGESPRPARTVDLTVRVSGSPRGRRRDDIGAGAIHEVVPRRGWSMENPSGSAGRGTSS